MARSSLYTHSTTTNNALLIRPRKWGKKMQKRRLPILQKVSHLLKLSMFVAKMRRKPIIAKLVLLKKSRRLKRFKLLNNYDHSFLQEYQFSASSTPLIGYHKKQQLRSRLPQEFFFLSRCFGGLKSVGRRGEAPEYSLATERYMHGVAGDREVLDPLDLDQDDDEEDSVDQRAERFIEWFYQEMRLQRQESI